LDELLLDSASAKEEHPHYSFYIDQYLNMSLASKEVGVFNSDMHSGNIGRKGDHLVAFDLGFSETVSRTEGVTLSLFI
jgi:predicted unusual protein kinase regulating ubiquinone biosynthesis (AarF/ABC1/UbiB family)